MSSHVPGAAQRESGTLLNRTHRDDRPRLCGASLRFASCCTASGARCLTAPISAAPATHSLSAPSPPRPASSRSGEPPPARQMRPSNILLGNFAPTAPALAVGAEAPQRASRHHFSIAATPSVKLLPKLYQTGRRLTRQVHRVLGCQWRCARCARISLDDSEGDGGLFVSLGRHHRRRDIDAPRLAARGEPRRRG